MNWYWIVAGTLAVLGGLAHMILGEYAIISRLDPARLPASGIATGDTVKRYLRWFWHVGSVVILGAAALILIIGLTDGVVPAEDTFARLLALQFGGMFIAFAVVAIPSPRHFLIIPQGPAMLAGAIILWLGALPG